jgi:hypothetical protein
VVMARKPGEPYRLETRGLASLIDGPSAPRGAYKALSAKRVVPVERIELPTFGLQNRCSTAELNRRIEGAIKLYFTADGRRNRRVVAGSGAVK